MQPDDPSITPVSTVAAATASSNFLALFVLMVTPFYCYGLPSGNLLPDCESLPDYRMLSRSFNVCAILRQPLEGWLRYGRVAVDSMTLGGGRAP